MKTLIHPLTERYSDYLRDESGLSGRAESISFPRDEAGVAEIVTGMRAAGTTVTVQGGKTGLSGGGVPEGGHLLCMAGLQQIKEKVHNRLIVEPGVTLASVRETLAGTDYFWPPDPSETSATVGGIFSNHARGPCSYLYGKTSRHIEAIRVVCADGTCQQIRRGDMVVPFMGKEKDLLDIFLGSEGMYGVVTELTLCLQEKLREKWGILFFFDGEEDALGFAGELREKTFTADASVAAAEYLDRGVIALLSAYRDVVPTLAELPQLDAGRAGMVYVEIHGRCEAGVEAIAEELLEMAPGWMSDPEEAWAVSGELEVEKLRAFRHLVMECAGLMTAALKRQLPQAVRQGLEIRLNRSAVKETLADVRTRCREDGLRCAVLGSPGEGYLSVMLLPDCADRYGRGAVLLENWAETLQGKATAGGGCGKVRKGLYERLMGQDAVREVKRLRKRFDPDGFWNPGNLF